MSFHTNDYIKRVADKQERELARQRQVLARKAECENVYAQMSGSKRDSEGKLRPHREAPEAPMPPPPPPLLTAKPDYINQLPFNPDIPGPFSPNQVPQMSDDRVRQLAETLDTLKMKLSQPK